MSLEEIEEKEVKFKESQIKKVYGIDTGKIKILPNGRAYIHISSKIKKEVGAIPDPVLAKSRDALIEKLFELLFGTNSLNLNDWYEKYHSWRLSIGTTSKTLKEEQFNWNRFYKDSIGMKNTMSLTVSIVRDQFLTMTAENAITRKCFTDAKSVLNGVFMYCVEQGAMSENLISKVNFRAFAKRFKPETSKKDFTRTEVKTIVCDLRSSTDVYDYAIRFAFNACLRFGELRAIKYSDVKDGTLTIRRSASDVMPAYLDKDGKVAFGKTETRETYTKGATKEGIRDFPLTKEAQEIVEAVHKENPDQEYLFMSNGAPLKACTFNRHLKKVCDANDIEYRPSHVIRFTNCDALFNEANVSVQSMQGYMGHSRASMTDHYIAKHKSKAEDNEKVIDYLGIG